MSYFDDIKKKGQNFVQSAGNAVNKAANNLVQTVQNTGNAANNAVKNVYNTAVQGVNNVKGAINQGVNNVQNAAMGNTGAPQQNMQQAAMDQDNTDWVAEYDRFKAEEAMAGASGVPGGNTGAAQPNASAGGASGAQNQPSNPQDITQSPQWQAELDSVMNKILNREKFEYDMNGDAMYQQYADIYKNQANLGMENAMAQASAMTGGYGSSYGQMVGQQAFAQQMQGLNEVGMDLYDRAVNEYIMEGDQLAQQQAMLADRENTLYQRDYQEGRDSVADEQWNKSFAENQRQFDEGLDHDKEMQDDAQEFTASENALDRTHETSEREASQAWQSGENKAERDWQDANREDEQSWQNENREDTQNWQSGENELDRVWEEYLQNDAQEHQSNENALDRTHDSAENELNREQDQDQFDSLYGEDGYYTNKDAQEQKNYEAEVAKEDAKEAKNNVMGLIGSGIEPTSEELEAAGMTTERYNEYKGAYEAAAAAENSGVSFGAYTAKEFTDRMFGLSDDLEEIVNGDEFASLDDAGKAKAISQIRSKAQSMLEGAGYSSAANEIYYNFFQKYEDLFAETEDGAVELTTPTPPPSVRPSGKFGVKNEIR